jgi:mannose-1-phosphate guanylyltransferase
MDAGLNDFIINTHYLADQVAFFIDNSSFGNNCTLKNEVELLGTAGTLLTNLEFIGQDDCLLIHADNYCLADFKEFQNAHKNRPSNCLMTMMTFKTEDPSSCGIVEIDKENIVVAFHEKVNNPPGNLANGAIYILSQQMIEILRLDFKNVNDFSREIIDNFAGRIFSYETKEVFMDIGTPSNYKRVND